jgi:hypothetical protein
MDFTNWEKVGSYNFTELEKKLMQILAQEYFDPKNNSAFEDISQPELDTLFEAFKHSWIVANISFEEKENPITVLREVMEWINNWSPDFTDDPEWSETEEKVDKLLGGYR